MNAHLPQRRPLTRPFNPFAHIAGGPALGLGLAAILLASPTSSTAAASARLLGNTPLPEPVPQLNKKENFFVGNGIAAGGGSGHGRWDYLVGPDYTCPNYLRNEEFKLVVDGEERSVGVDVHRLRGTGLFYGVCAVGDLEVCLLDYALWGEPWVARLVLIRNASAGQAHNIRVRACISPLAGAGRSALIVRDAQGRASGVGLKLDTSLRCVMDRFCPNWAERYALLTFNEAPAAVSEVEGTYVLESPSQHLAAGASCSVVLYHYMHYGGDQENALLERVRERDGVGDAERCLRQWQEWFANVDAQYSLDRIKDQRARDIVEGGLALLKMNQCRDGGIVSQVRGWNMSYVRDAYCALRGLSECGHFDELRRFIRWLDHQYSVHGCIPNAAPGGSDTYAHPSGNSGGPCPEANAAVEVTALHLLAARDYLKATHDLQTLTNADKSLRYAMEVQLKQALANGYRLEFSGDETELCPVDVSPTGFNGKLARYWSMSSVALCAASLDFYIRYLREKGADPAAYTNSLDHRPLNLPAELGRLQEALEADFWRTNMPECPGGFHDWFRVKSDGSWPRARVVNFTLFPLYYGTPLKYPERARLDVAAMAADFNQSTGLLPLLGVADGKSLGHDLGYLLWGMVTVGDARQPVVYNALVNGPTVACWGSYNESYGPDGAPPNGNGLRSFETGVNVGAIARYWGLGKGQGGGRH
jgi:hypothetical protein